MEENADEDSDRVDLLDLSNIQPPTPDSQPEGADAPESIDEPNIYSKIIEGNLNDDLWQVI